MITEPEWASIRALVERLVPSIAGSKNHFLTSKVLKRDTVNNLIWISELGDQPIPVVGLDYNIKTYDTDNSGVVQVRNSVASPKVPDVGEAVFVVLEGGSQGLPRCLGTIQGRNWVIPEEEGNVGLSAQ